MSAAMQRDAGRLKVAYLVNQYPLVSHSFIRREILALERRGIEVQRYAVRGWDAMTPDPADAAEQTRTRYLLARGVLSLLMPWLRVFASAPLVFVSAFATARRLSRQSDRPLRYHLVYLAEACVLREWLRSSGAVHLHAHFGTNAAEVALLTRSLGGPPFSFTVHGPEEFDGPTALHLGEKATAAAFVVAISAYGRSQLYRWIGAAEWPRIEVVHCGLEDGFLGDEHEASTPDAARLVCVGRLCEQKGQLLLLEAVHRLVTEGVAIELVLAGDGEMRAQIEAAIDARNLRPHVRITGWIGSEQVKREILGSRALVLASLAEGLPVVLMETMALGRAVVTTWIAGIPELVRDGVNGWLVMPGDVDALAQAIRACLAAPVARLDAMGARGRDAVRERHDIDREAAKLALLFARSAGAAREIRSER